MYNESKGLYRKAMEARAKVKELEDTNDQHTLASTDANINTPEEIRAAEQEAKRTTRVVIEQVEQVAQQALRDYCVHAGDSRFADLIFLEKGYVGDGDCLE